MLRKNKEGNVEVFYTDDIQIKKIFDTERKKHRTLRNIQISEDNKKRDLRNRQKIASDLRKIKIFKKEVLL